MILIAIKNSIIVLLIILIVHFLFKYHLEDLASSQKQSTKVIQQRTTEAEKPKQILDDVERFVDEGTRTPGNERVRFQAPRPVQESVFHIKPTEADIDSFILGEDKGTDTVKAPYDDEMAMSLKKGSTMQHMQNYGGSMFQNIIPSNMDSSLSLDDIFEQTRVQRVD